jgi:hypothetical protein
VRFERLFQAYSCAGAAFVAARDQQFVIFVF